METPSTAFLCLIYFMLGVCNLAIRFLEAELSDNPPATSKEEACAEGIVSVIFWPLYVPRFLFFLIVATWVSWLYIIRLTCLGVAIKLKKIMNKCFNLKELLVLQLKHIVNMRKRK